MSVSLSDFSENTVGNWMLRAIAPPTLTRPYVSLFTALSNDGQTVTEVSASPYARVQASFYPPTTSGVFPSSGTIQFAEATSSWGTVTHVGLWDASTGGRLLMWGALDEARAIASGEILQFLDQQLVCSFT